MFMYWMCPFEGPSYDTTSLKPDQFPAIMSLHTVDDMSDLVVYYLLI